MSTTVGFGEPNGYRAAHGVFAAPQRLPGPEAEALLAGVPSFEVESYPGREATDEAEGGEATEGGDDDREPEPSTEY